jgi:uncharacterized protein HemY
VVVAPLLPPTEDETLALRLRLGRALLARGNHAGARLEAARALAEHPRDVRTVGLFAEAALQGGDAGATIRVAGPHAGSLDRGQR